MKKVILCAVMALVGCGGGGGGDNASDGGYDWNGTWVLRVDSVANPCQVANGATTGTDVILTVSQNGTNISVRNVSSNFTGVGSTTNNGDTFLASSTNPVVVTCTNGVRGSVTEAIGFSQIGDNASNVVYTFGATCSDLCTVTARGLALRQ